MADDRGKPRRIGRSAWRLGRPSARLPAAGNQDGSVYNGHFGCTCSHLRTVALTDEVEHWSLTTLSEKLVKIGAKVVRHGRYVTFQLAEVAIHCRCSPKSCN